MPQWLPAVRNTLDQRSEELATDVSRGAADVQPDVGARPVLVVAQPESSWTVPVLHGASTLLAMPTAASVRSSADIDNPAFVPYAADYFIFKAAGSDDGH